MLLRKPEESDEVEEEKEDEIFNSPEASLIRNVRFFSILRELQFIDIFF